MDLRTRAREQRVQATEKADPRERFTLAPALDGADPEWHETGNGYVGITRHVSQDGATVRDFVTFAPSRGRVQSIPVAALYAHPEVAGEADDEEADTSALDVLAEASLAAEADDE